MKWLRKIIGLCVHQYETVDECIFKKKWNRARKGLCTKVQALW